MGQVRRATDHRNLMATGDQLAGELVGAGAGSPSTGTEVLMKVQNFHGLSTILVSACWLADDSPSLLSDFF